jgi:hypothetical protein
MNTKGSNKWKDALLKTSLPLEHVVAEKLEGEEFDIWGEFTYERKNEQGLDTEFSVDVRAINFVKKRGIEWANLNLLIECKYNYPGVKWVFAPHPGSSITVVGVINTFQDLCTKRITSNAAYDVDYDLPFCVKGIELHESDANLQSIARGLHQLRWAVPQLASEILRQQATTRHEEDLEIGFVCPILVTTSPLYVLHRGLSLQDFQNASDLQQVAESVDALVVSQERGPQLNQYIRNVIANLHKNAPALKERLQSFWQIVRTSKERKHLPANWDFDQSIDFIAQRVLIVNLDAFEAVVAKIRNSVTECGKTLRRVAKFRTDVNTGFVVIEPASKTKV